MKDRIGPVSINSLLHIKINTKSKNDIDFKMMYRKWKCGDFDQYYKFLQPEIQGKVEPEGLDLEDESIASNDDSNENSL